jgi:hypothetical protein
VKNLLANIPQSAEVYWRLFEHSGPTLHYSGHNSLERLASFIPTWLSQSTEARQNRDHGKRLMVFATFRYWIEQVVLMGFALAGLGHDITLTTLPYVRYKIPADRFDLQRQDAYLSSILRQARPLLKSDSLLRVRPDMNPLPQLLREAVEEISLRDAQYSMRVEDVRREGDLFKLRMQRNEYAARVALGWFEENRPDIVIVPNGSILEYAVVYQVARFLDYPVVTYEFDEPQHRIRLVKNAEVMREDTGDFWKARKSWDFTSEQRERVQALLAARQKGSLWENFPIQFQGVPRQGTGKVRAELGLDERPIVLLAPNVFGDSATLGRQIFSDSMTEWLERTLEFYSTRSDIQVLVRIHPSEARFPYGTLMADVVRKSMPNLPEHIHLILADDDVNTYDLIEIADLGLVYTTTVGMEMAMSGVPVVVTGFTHYREKGFTLDPDGWDDYFNLLERAADAPQEYRLTTQQVGDAWHYAYRFFFEFTLPFPWHLLYFWDDVDEWPLDRVLSDKGLSRFGDTFRVLAGDRLDWSTMK